MADDNTKTTDAASAAPPKIDGSKVDPEGHYRVQLAKYVPDYRGSELTKIAPLHITGASVLELLHLDPDCIATIEEDDTFHPDQKATEDLDEHVSVLTDARAFRTTPLTAYKATAMEATNVKVDGAVQNPSVSQAMGKGALRRR